MQHTVTNIAYVEFKNKKREKADFILKGLLLIFLLAISIYLFVYSIYQFIFYGLLSRIIIKNNNVHFPLYLKV